MKIMRGRLSGEERGGGGEGRGEGGWGVRFGRGCGRGGVVGVVNLYVAVFVMSR